MNTQNDVTTALEAEEAKAGDQVTAETSVTDPAEESAQGETPEENAGEEDEAEEPASPTTPADAKAKDAPSTLEVIQNDPYDFERCQVQVSLLFLPRTGDEPRMAVCGVKTHDDDPLIEIKPGDEIMATLPADILEMIEKVKTQLPTRAMERMAKKQAPAFKKKAKSASATASTAKVAPQAPVKAPNAPKLSAAVLQPDLFSMLGGAK